MKLKIPARLFPLNMPLKLRGNADELARFYFTVWFSEVTFTKRDRIMSKNILFYLKDIEKNIRNHCHLILSMDLDDSSWFHALGDSITHKIKANMQNLADKPFTTLVVISTKPSNTLYKEFGLRELVYAGNCGLDILYQGSQAVNHDSLGKNGVIAGFYHELCALMSRFQELLLTNKHYSVQVRLREKNASFPEMFMDEMRKILAKYPNISMVQSRKILEFTLVGFFQKDSIHSRVQKFLGKSNTLDLYIGNHLMHHRKKVENCGILAISSGKTNQSFSDYHLDDMEDLLIFLNWLNDADCVNYFVPACSEAQLN